MAGRRHPTEQPPPAGARTDEGEAVDGPGPSKPPRRPRLNPEDRTTTLWSPVADSLFKEELEAKREASRQELAVEPSAPPRGELDTQREIAVARQVMGRHRPVEAGEDAPLAGPAAGDRGEAPETTPEQEAPAPPAAQEPPTEQGVQSHWAMVPEPGEGGQGDGPAAQGPESADEEQDSSESMAVSGEIDLDPDTLELSPRQILRAQQEGRRVDSAEFRRAEREAYRLLAASVEVRGREADAAVELAEAMRQERETDPNRTLVVDRPPNAPKLRGECRMCGRRITRPEKRRLRGPASSPHGFRCEKCHNLFCAAHVVRVSGLIPSILFGARFRCQLCL